MFKKKRSIHLPYEVQGYIQFLCYTIKMHDKTAGERIIGLCKEICGADYKILYELLTSKRKTLERIARDNYISERRLSLWRSCFFETYARRYMKK